MNGDLSPESEKSEYSVERALPTDAAGVYDVMRTTWLDTYPNQDLGISFGDIRTRVEGEHGKDIPARIDRWRRTIEDPDRTVFVAKHGARVVGYLAPFFDEDQQQYRIGALYVLPGLEMVLPSQQD